MVQVPGFNAQVGMRVCCYTVHNPRLTMFPTVPHWEQLTVAQIRSSVLHMSDLCLTSIPSISPRGFPCALAKPGVWWCTNLWVSELATYCTLRTTVQQHQVCIGALKEL